ncbi:MAG: VWA domain-containing protein [Alphaproteobacteria bacterium]|nr:VWA domain-containing protein [Alphaproteobacteria bacterium]
MNEFIENFHFLRPLWLLLLILPILFYFKYYKGAKNKSAWEKVCDKNLLAFLLIKGSSKTRKSIGYLAMTAIITSLIAISGPTWQKKEVPSLSPENPTMILLNLSTDMLQTDVKPNRLEAAKYKIIDLLKEIKFAEVGLIVYSDEPYLISPITEDVALISNLLRAIDTDIVPTNGDRLDRAINLATESLKNGDYPLGNLIIFTPDVSQKLDLVIKETQNAYAKGYVTSFINMSVEDNEKLEHIAKVSHGTYQKYTINDQDIDAIAKQANQKVNDILKKSENLSTLWQDFGYFLVIIPLFCCLYFFRRGVFVFILVFGFSNIAHAGFFENANQQALRYFQQGRFEKASETFKNSNWKASSYYRLNDFEKATQEFAKDNSIEGFYNQGNALAKSGKIEEAIKKYEEVLKQNPEHEDAKFNLEYLKQQQNQQNQENQDNKENQDNQEDQKNNQSSAQQDSNQQNEQKNQEQQEGNNQEQKDSQQPQQGEKDNQPQKSEQNQKKPINPSESPEEESELEGKQKTEEAQKDGEEDWSEERQAREQQYRDIPEDPGGLLRAFIYKEHLKNRYHENNSSR